MKKEIKYTTDSEGFNWPIPSIKSSRERSWITHVEIAFEFPEFIDKIADVLFNDIYHPDAKAFARSVLEFLNDWQFVTWKQFDSIFRICKCKEDYYESLKNGTQIVKYKNVLSIRRNDVSMTLQAKHVEVYNAELLALMLETDRGVDKFYKKIFGHRPVFPEEQEDGMIVDYRPDGSRYFRLPLEEDMKLHNFVDFY